MSGQRARGLFVTGTDTGCGKTEVALGLMCRLQARGHSVLGMKPVASGARESGGRLCNDDALRLQAQCSSAVAYPSVNPCVLSAPVAPHLAARQAGQAIDLQPILAAYADLAAHADWVVVEGVGGWRVPLGEDWDVGDLALALGLPVILVVGLRLGCLNHALLTLDSMLRRGAHLWGWVANDLDPQMLLPEENLATLRERLPGLFLGRLPRLDRAEPAAVAGHLRWPE